MKLKEIIKGKLVKSGFDKNEIMVETIVKLMTPALEEKAGKMVTPRLIKRAVTDMLAATNEDEQKRGDE